MSTELTVEGMACDGCGSNVEEAIADVVGVNSVDADHENGTVVVEGDASIDALVGAVDDAGYEATA